MSQQQFINANNQSLLWKVINNTPQVIRYFDGASPGEKEKWFQYVIGQVYNHYRGQNIPLKELNKRAIDAMLQQVTVVQPSAPAPASPLPISQPKKSSSSSIQDQFSRRQAEYESMVKKEVPTPTFTENVKDEAILDLNSAVEAYKRNRNEDSSVIIPPPQGSPQGSQPGTDDPISIKVEEIPKKGVKWGDNTEHIFDTNYSVVLEKDIAEIKSQLKEILALLKRTTFPLDPSFPP